MSSVIWIAIKVHDWAVLRECWVRNSSTEGAPIQIFLCITPASVWLIDLSLLTHFLVNLFSYLSFPLLYHLSSHQLAPLRIISGFPVLTFVGVIMESCAISEELCVIRLTSILGRGHEMSAANRDGWMDGWGSENPLYLTQKTRASLACDGSPNKNGIRLIDPYEVSSFIGMVMTLVLFKWNSAVNVNNEFTNHFCI